MKLMRSWVAVIVFLVASPAVTQSSSWELKGLENGSLSQSDLQSGKTVILVWAGWSPRCRDMPKRARDLTSELSGKARVVTVNFQEDASEVRAFLSGRGMGAPTYLDTEGVFSRQHRVTTLPGLVVYSEGEVTYQGKLPVDPSNVLAKALN